MKTKLIALLSPLLWLSISTASGQCDPPDFGDDPKTKDEFALLGDNVKNKNYKEAIPHLNWILANKPTLHTSIYVQSTILYDELAKAEKDPKKKRIYIDSLMTLYDLRIKYCGEQPTVLNRKALSAYFFDLNTEGKEKWLLDLFDKVFELNGDNVMDATLVPYFQIVQLNELKFNSLTDEQILDRYDKLISIIEAKRKKNPTNDARYIKYKEQIDAILMTPGMLDDITCDFIINSMAPRYKKDPTDRNLISRIFQLMIQAKCTDHPLWLEVGDEYVKDNPDFNVLKVLGIQYWAQGNIAKAEAYFKKAQSVAATPQEKAEALILQGKIEAKKNNKVAARQLFRQALAAQPGNKEAYEAIGDLYYSSFEECAKEESYAQDRLVFIAAYEMYAKAGNKSKMADAKAAFPSASELHDLNWKPGETKRVGCWIDEDVVLQKRSD